ncbi:MAG: PP2C family serine/threonine-protein phosphatase, partial [Candidatus Omnitrophota bacterium]
MKMKPGENHLTNVQPQWCVIGKSVQGASHVRNGMPNQDAWYLLPQEEENEWLCVAVADGHGGNKYFRSHDGARFAVESAVNALKKIYEDMVDNGKEDPSFIKRNMEESVPRLLVQVWRRAIDDDLVKKPFDEDEWKTLEQKAGNNAQESIEKSPYIAYGATILAALVTGKYIFYMQLGDGDIMTVSDEGEVSKPMPADARLIANETTSLCGKDAWRDFRFAFQFLVDKPPALIMLSTDGYANSFSNEDAFLKVGPDVLDILKKEGR